MQKAPRGCQILRHITNFDELPAHLKAHKELLAIKEEGGDDFQLVGVVFKSTQVDPNPGYKKTGFRGSNPCGPKYTDQYNWVAFNKQRGMSSQRTLNHGSGKCVVFGARSKKAGKKRQRV